jgi:hypothetical protein
MGTAQVQDSGDVIPPDHRLKGGPVQLRRTAEQAGLNCR